MTVWKDRSKITIKFICVKVNLRKHAFFSVFLCCCSVFTAWLQPSEARGGFRILVLGGALAGSLGMEVLQWDPGADPQWGSGENIPEKPEECCVAYVEKKVRLTLCYNIIIIVSYLRRFLFPDIFVLTYKTQSAGSRASEMVHNGSRSGM